ncbi:syndecan-like [Oppia nitens]|uniref:syndecan-like n=1 Tax=Oppia nitens TaxID=1686743 RepID=UPI0023D9F2D6|nr:syndecan-like [Oppia nitens]
MYYCNHLVVLLVVLSLLWPTISAQHNKFGTPTSPKIKSNTHITHTNSRANGNNNNGGIYFSDIPLNDDDEGSADGPDVDDLEENASGKGEDDEDSKHSLDKEGSGSRPIISGGSSGVDSDDDSSDDDEDDTDLELGSGDDTSLFISSSTERPTTRPDVTKPLVTTTPLQDFKHKLKDPIEDPINNRVPTIPPVMVSPVETSTRYTVVSSTQWTPSGKDHDSDGDDDDDVDDNDGGDDNNSLGNEVSIMGHKQMTPASFFARPGILAAVIGGAVVGLLCAILLVMFIVYRMRKKDEGSYALDEPKRQTVSPYARGASKEFYA